MAGCLSPILYSTINIIVRDDAEERALIMVCPFPVPVITRTDTDISCLALQGAMMTFGYSFNIWVPLLAYPTAGPDGAPRWRKGWPISFVFFFLLWAGFVASVYIWRR